VSAVVEFVERGKTSKEAFKLEAEIAQRETLFNVFQMKMSSLC